MSYTLLFFHLCPLGEVVFSDVGQIVVGNGLLGKIWVVRSEDKDSLSSKQECVDVGETDARFAEYFNSVGGTSRLVVHL